MVQWRTVLWISFSVFVVTSVVYICFGSGEEQWWNEPKERENVEKGEKVKN